MLRIPMVSVLFWTILGAGLPQAETVVQIPVTSILNTRSVTTLTDGKLVNWQVGIDGDGKADGYLTSAASLFVGDKNVKALPDSGKFPADARHPEVVLNYSNSDGTSNQTRYVQKLGEFTMPVPPARYSKLFMFFTSSEGPTTLTFILTYSDSVETVKVNLPDYFDVITNNPAVFNLATDMAKWNHQNVPVEKTHHNLDGIELHPALGLTLTEIKVSKGTNGSYLVFWGATGIATSPVSIGMKLRPRTVRSHQGMLFLPGSNQSVGKFIPEFRENGFSVLGRTNFRFTYSDN